VTVSHPADTSPVGLLTAHDLGRSPALPPA
jgi:hypothetical protein